MECDNLQNQLRVYQLYVCSGRFWIIGATLFKLLLIDNMDSPAWWM